MKYFKEVCDWEDDELPELVENYEDMNMKNAIAECQEHIGFFIEYVKAGNYWRWLKKKLAAQGVQPVSDTHEFKLVGPDGKKRVADVMDDNGVLLLAKHYPNNRTNEFLDWFT